MSKESQQIKKQEITTAGGFVHGVYMNTATAREIAIMVRANLDKMIEVQFAGRLKNPSVKAYIEAIEDKIQEAERVANYKGKKQ